MEPVIQSRPDQPEISPFNSFLSRHGAGILALVPFILLLWVVVQYAVAMPYWDQWELCRSWKRLIMAN